MENTPRTEPITGRDLLGSSGGCSCGCCGDTAPAQSRDEEIAELRQLHSSVEERLAELEGR
ncbi:MAG: hypothetical protein M3N57_06605 [Actinomycetota bacterium]|nr:hypothetical protein [Actinomycetota bacterium]